MNDKNNPKDKAATPLRSLRGVKVGPFRLPASILPPRQVREPEPFDEISVAAQYKQRLKGLRTKREEVTSIDETIIVPKSSRSSKLSSPASDRPRGLPSRTGLFPNLNNPTVSSRFGRRDEGDDE